ncbi:MAG: VOC family protein [Lewinellaceae bacterium]|jgi:predicted enzyme related to lactoylglutathione lyase|nr:VOC family protein [Lewinellaceae bacterium]
MEFAKNSISWFEIPVVDFERAKTFYQAIFDYEMPEMQMDAIRMGILLHDRDGGGIGGAICHGEGYAPSGHNGPKVYLNGGADLNIVLGRVDAAGGKQLLPKTPIGENMGHFAFFNDTEGNVVGLYSME